MSRDATSAKALYLMAVRGDSGWSASIPAFGDRSDAKRYADGFADEYGYSDDDVEVIEVERDA